MSERLDPYQLEGAEFLAGRYRASLFDEPGLGKTAQFIRACELVQSRRELVICPAGVRQVWPEQWREWGRTLKRVVKAGSIHDVDAWNRGAFSTLVVSFEQAVNWQQDLALDFIDVLGVDEAHYLKNPEAKRTRAVIGLEGNGEGGILGMAGRGWFLTGTPQKNDPADLWIYLRTGGVMDLGYTAFQKRYFTQRTGTFTVSNTVKKSMLPELQALIGMVSRMRTFESVGEQLPPIRLDALGVDGDSSEVVNFLRSYPGLSDAIVRTLEEEGRLSFADGTHVATLRALIAEAKAPGYAELVAEELLSGTIDKLVVMAHHRRAIEIVAEHLGRKKIRVAMIHGGTSERERTAAVSSFQHDPNGIRVIVGNIQAAGTGLTMTAACRLDMLESDWTPANNVQAIRRVRRKGQKRPTLARFVMLNNSFDAVVAKIVRRKANEIALITKHDNLIEAMV